MNYKSFALHLIRGHSQDSRMITCLLRSMFFHQRGIYPVQRITLAELVLDENFLHGGYRPATSFLIVLPYLGSTTTHIYHLET